MTKQVGIPASDADRPLNSCTLHWPPRKRNESEFAAPETLPALFGVRILPFDNRATFIWARLMAEGKAAS
ncbi:MAG: hypothetical protein ACLPN5_23920 [Roseiarcus sp.]|jgi:hypothetical protein